VTYEMRVTLSGVSRLVIQLAIIAAASRGSWRSSTVARARTFASSAASAARKRAGLKSSDPCNREHGRG
jgi:hypothetical protein